MRSSLAEEKVNAARVEVFADPSRYALGDRGMGPILHCHEVPTTAFIKRLNEKRIAGKV